MEFPNLPTDNLYKFRTLSGLMIALFFISVFIIRLGKLKENINKIIIEIGELSFEKILLNEKDSLLTIEINQLSKSMKRYKLDQPDSVILFNNIIDDLHDPDHREYLKFIYTYQEEIVPEFKIFSDLNERIIKREENNYLLRSKANTIGLKNESLQSELKSLQRFYWLMILGIGIGTFLAISGFKLWYTRVQIFLDIQLENQTKNSKIEK